jgi:hypothetical protein
MSSRKRPVAVGLGGDPVIADAGLGILTGWRRPESPAAPAIAASAPLSAEVSRLLDSGPQRHPLGECMSSLIADREQRPPHSRRVGRTRGRLSAAVAVVAVGLITAACSSGSTTSATGAGVSQSSGGSTSSASSGGGASSPGVAQAQAAVTAATAVPAKIFQDVPLPSAPPKGKLAVFLGNSQPQDAAVGQAFAVAIKALGWNYKEFSYDPANPATLNEAAMNALALKPAIVAETGNPPSQFSSSVLSAYAAAKLHIEVDASDPCATTNVIVGCSTGGAYFEGTGKLIADCCSRSRTDSRPR